MKQAIKIATRKSAMALVQANFVKNSLKQQHPSFDFVLVEMQTEGDRFLEKPLIDIGGKALFVKALEQGLLTKEADFAVHCVKDMPCELPSGLAMAAVLKRDNPCDVLVSNQYHSLNELPEGAVVGTSSPRRQSQLLRYRSDLTIKLLRGNVLSRLEKLDQGEYAAIILAAAGLERLKLENRMTEVLNPYVFIPAIGQGALCIECLDDREDVKKLVKALHHPETALAIHAERRVNQILGGSCHVALGAYARIESQDIYLQAMVGSKTGMECIYAQGIDDCENALALGEKVAEDLLKQGAKTLLI